MDHRHFTNPSGSLVPLSGGGHAFVPTPLPPSIDLAAIAMPMSDSMQAVGELRGACRRLQNPYILIRPLQRREALTSSAMEGTFTTNDNLLLVEAGIHTVTDDDTREVANYLHALGRSLELLKTLPICHRVLQSAHDTLLGGLSAARGAYKNPGAYKTEQNWIGGRIASQARFVPPPPAETQLCMDALERYLNRDDRSYPTPLMDLALVHYQLETIHPFADGNGRVGRMLISLMAVHHGLLDSPVLYISPVLEDRKDEYIDLMYNVSSRSEWTEWLIFFFARVSDACRSTVKTIDRMLALQDRFRQLVRGAGRSASAITLVDILFDKPIISVNEAATRLGITYPAARGAIERLNKLGIIQELASTYPKLFYAPDIWRAADPDRGDAA